MNEKPKTSIPNLNKNNEHDSIDKVKDFLNELITHSDKITNQFLIIETPQIIDILDKQQDNFLKLTSSLSNANAQSAELIADAEEKNKQLQLINDKLAEANASSAELMAELELKNEKIQALNNNLAKANAEASELIVTIESQREELKKAHEELNILNKHLEQKVLERTEEIRHLLLEKDEFINELAHDLRTPLTPLINLMPLLRSKERNQKRLELLEIIMKNVDRIHRVVNKTVKIATLNSPKFELNNEKIVINNHINDIINNLDYDNQKYKIVNNINTNFQIFSDAKYLEDLFTNLIDNAIKFNPNGGEITIFGEQIDDFIQISIKDQGIGLSSTELEHVFDDFYKADWSRHDLTSSGLGLTICKKIIQKYNGKIWAESEGKNKGATFIFTLPKIADIKENIVIEEKIYDEIDEVIKNQKARLK